MVGATLGVPRSEERNGSTQPKERAAVSLIQSLGGRKSALAVIYITGLFILAVMDKIPAKDATDQALYVVLGAGGLIALEDAAKKRAAPPPAAPPEPPKP